LRDTQRAVLVHEELAKLYPDTRPLLDFSTPFELLIAVILSAQTTDAQVNRATPALFRRFPDPASLATAEIPEIESLIRSVGFYRVKARHLREAASMLERRWDGGVPDRKEDLMSLPGVGGKTANVVLSVVYGKPAIIVDTHFGRVVRRLGFTDSEDPSRVEAELERIVPEEIRSPFSMRVNLHGRRCCTARAPACAGCAISQWCRYHRGDSAF